MCSGYEIAFHSDLCINCGDCAKVCPSDAISECAERVDREKCTLCGKCVDECPSTALKIVGEYYSPHELVEKLKDNKIFYDTSKGGVTFSGGEPTMYMDYLEKVLKGLRDSDIHVAIQTAGYFDIQKFKSKILPHIDLIFYDIKFVDLSQHKKYTGKSNHVILSNFIELLKERDVKVIPIVPLVPKITSTHENLKQIAAYLKNAGCTEWRLLPYNPGGISKSVHIGRSVPSCLPRVMHDITEEEKLIAFFQRSFFV